MTTSIYVRGCQSIFWMMVAVTTFAGFIVEYGALGRWKFILLFIAFCAVGYVTFNEMARRQLLDKRCHQDKE